jgi:hypothetical protein
MRCTNDRIVADVAAEDCWRRARGAPPDYSGLGYHSCFAGQFFMSSKLLENLNPSSSLPVTLPHASALILAGAGSGKTRVLTTRIAWLLATGQAGPLSISP